MALEGLMLHCGADAITRQELNNVLPGPALGRFHNPQPYAEFVDMVSDSLADNGLHIKQEQYGVLGDGSRMFGLMSVATNPGGTDFDKLLEGEYVPGTKGYETVVGLRGSYDQSLPRGLALGSRVFVCDNLCFSGEITLKTKQTTNLMSRLPGLISSAVSALPALANLQDARYEHYKSSEMKPRWGDAAITELVRRGSINPSHVGKVIAEWDTPSHEEHSAQGWSAWRFHNAVTEAIKPPEGRPAVLAAQARTIKLTRFLDEATGFSKAGLIGIDSDDADVQVA